MNMPFSRPGAVDLSGLKRPAAPVGGGGPAGSGGSSSGAPGSYAVDVDEQNFQALLESSMTAPIVVVVYSPSRMPASAQLAADFTLLADELNGRIAVGLVDVDAQPAIAQALQVQTVPFVAMVLQGRLAPLLQDAPPLEELRTIMAQVLEQMTAQGMTGRHQPLAGGVSADADGEGDESEPESDPRYAAADEALMTGDLDIAIAEYQKLLDANPADAEAALGVSRSKLMQRTASTDPATARSAAADAPDDVDAQTLVADLDLLGGHVNDAFARLIDLVRRTSGDERDRARLHLIELFGVVGNEDPRVIKARRELASALF